MTSVPLLNDYKRKFVIRRFLRTLTGGIHLKFCYRVPIYIYLMQFSIFLIPCILSILFTLMIEERIVSTTVGVVIYSFCVFLFTLISHIVSMYNYRKKENHGHIIDQTKKTNISLSDEDDHISFDGPFGQRTISFLIPPKKYKINIFIHATFCAVLCGLALIYLLPTEMYMVFSYTAVIVIMSFLSWMTVLLAVYSYLSAPPLELAIYRALDNYELNTHTRPFYLLPFLLFGIFARSNMSLLLWRRCVHIVMVCLPLLWVIGILPPIDAFFIWIIEQVHLNIFGGTPMATDIRMFGMLLASLASVVIIYFVPSTTASVCIAAMLGCLLSADVVDILTQWSRRICRGCGKIGTSTFPYGSSEKRSLSRGGLDRSNSCNKPTNVSSRYFSKDFHAKQTTTSPCKPGNREALQKSAQSSHDGISQSQSHVLIYLITVLISVFVISFFLTYYNDLVSSISSLVLGCIIIALTIIEKVLRDVQSVYIFFGIFRNPLYERFCWSSSNYRFGRNSILPSLLQFLTASGELSVLLALSTVWIFICNTVTLVCQ